VCRDVDTDEVHVFKKPTINLRERKRFIEFARQVRTWIGHNFLGFDAVHLNRLIQPDVVKLSSVVDTLVVSKLVDYSRPEGHSLEAYGNYFGIPKGTDVDFSKYSTTLTNYCINDTLINLKVYLKYLKYIRSPKWKKALRTEHDMSVFCESLHKNGFAFNVNKADKLLKRILSELSSQDSDIASAFPPRPVLVREIKPSLTKHGTLHKKDFKWVKDGDLTQFNGGPFSLLKWQDFNPSSHKQMLNVLWAAGWSPTDKTKSHIDLEREINRLKWKRDRSKELDTLLSEYYIKLSSLRRTGWKINETNLSTLPESAPKPAKLLAKRILLESRRRTLVEWLGLVSKKTNRIHGKFYSIGAWTHRMAHQEPNTANIPRDANDDGTTKLYGAELRELWCAPKNRLLVGVDAEGIQLRVFAHYLDDKEFTKALVEGKKSDRSDPHSLNQRILGSACKTRQAAKRFIYSLLLGGGLGKLAEILGCTEPEAKEALDRLLKRYEGLAYLRREIIPRDAKRGWFEGLDGRMVRILGSTFGERKHLCMSGYLQNGEAVVMKMAALKAEKDLIELELPFKFVDLVHDEIQLETVNDMPTAMDVANTVSDAIAWAGEDLKLKCPMAGSFWNDDHQRYTIGRNWRITH
jgi:DNA polymerase-1